MAGLLNQAAPFIATCGFTLIATKFFYGTSGFQGKVRTELESINSELSKQSDATKELREQLKTVATSLKQMKEASLSQSKVNEAATKNLQKQLDALTKDLADGKKIIETETKKVDQDVTAVKAFGEKLSKDQAAVNAALSKLEAQMKKCSVVEIPAPVAPKKEVVVAPTPAPVAATETKVAETTSTVEAKH
jgi:uncharacterized protein (DUF3084 family)